MMVIVFAIVALIILVPLAPCAGQWLQRTVCILVVLVVLSGDVPAR